MTHLRKIARLAGVAVVAMSLALPALATEYIPGEEWPEIQRGIQVTQYPKLARLVNRLDQHPDAAIVISYPGGEAGQSWAREIRDWLVALGVSTNKLVLRPGSGVPGSLALDIERQTD